MGFYSSWTSYYIFSLAFAATIVAMWVSLVQNKDFAVFTDPDTVPAPTDIFGVVLGIDGPETEEVVSD